MPRTVKKPRKVLPMKAQAHTAEAICARLGISSFVNDKVCLDARRALRVLLMPSFHPEICLTFANEQVSVICAWAMVLHQLTQAPVFTDSAQGAVSQGVFQDLVEQVKALGTGSQSVVIDGMPAEYLLFQGGVLTHRGRENASGDGDFSGMVRAAITAAWDGIAGNAQARNALADASGYTGAALPHEPQALQKPKVVTMVLGAEDDRAQVVEALRRVNAAKK